MIRVIRVIRGPLFLSSTISLYDKSTRIFGKSAATYYLVGPATDPTTSAAADDLQAQLAPSVALFYLQKTEPRVKF